MRNTSNPLAGDAVLLSADPAREDHELVLVSNPAAEHIAFRVDTLQRLRALYTSARQRGLEIPYALDSSVAIGFFARDPEGHAVRSTVGKASLGTIGRRWPIPKRSTG